jgi:multicomponent Na+:H+ antiporter subunit A
VFLLALTAAGQHPSLPVSDQVVARALPDGHGRNLVNVILVDFRGYDTLGEITVLAAAAIGVVALARAGRRPRAPAAVEPPPPPPLVVVDVAVRLLFPAVLAGSLYLLFAGHNQPGGGFVGGIVAGAAVALRYVAGGIGEVRRLSHARPWTVLGTGLLIAAATAAAPLLAGRPLLETAETDVDLPVLGHVAVSSALVFDAGVYLVVLGLVLMVFESFGEEVPGP